MPYIDRDAFSKQLEHEKELMERGNTFNTALISHTIGIVQEKVKRFPTANVEPIVHAHWIDKEENIYGLPPNILRVCSNCDTEYESTFMAACCAFIPSDAFGAGDDTKFPKCPCCGALMDGKENEK